MAPLGQDAAVLAIVYGAADAAGLRDSLFSLACQTRPPDGVVVVLEAGVRPPPGLLEEHAHVTFLGGHPGRAGLLAVDGVLETLAPDAFDACLLQRAGDWSMPHRLGALLRHAACTGCHVVGSDHLALSPVGGARVVRLPRAGLLTPDHEIGHRHVEPSTLLVSAGALARAGGVARAARRAAGEALLRGVRPGLAFANIDDVLTVTRAPSSADPLALSSVERTAVAALALVPRADASTAASLEAAAPPEHLAGPRVAAARRGAGDTSPALSPPTGAASVGGPVFVVSPLPDEAIVAAQVLAHEAPLTGADVAGWMVELATAATRASSRERDVLACEQETTVTGRAQTHYRAAARAVDAVVEQQIARSGTGSGDGSAQPPSWVAVVPCEARALAAARLLYPQGSYVFVVRDVEASAAVRGAASLHELDGAYAAWVAAAEAWLDAWAALPQERVVRLDVAQLSGADPSTAVRPALALVGAQPSEAVTRFLSFVADAAKAPQRMVAEDSERGRAARRLSTALLGRAPAADGTRTGLAAMGLLGHQHEVRAPLQPALAHGPYAASLRLVERSVPADSVVAVVSKGDEMAVDFRGHAVGRHFPAEADGTYVGHHPADSAAARAALEQERRRGTAFLLVPPPSSWWVEHYDEFFAWLTSDHRVVAEDENVGLLVELRPERGPSGPPDSRPRSSGARRRRLEADGTFDVVVFWKQNDSGLYGRRHDMVVEQIAAHPRVASVVQLDAAIGWNDLQSKARSSALEQGRWIYEITRRRMLGLEDRPGLARHTVVFDDSGSRPWLPRREDHVGSVADVLEHHGIGPRPFVFWVYPTGLAMPGLIDALQPDLVVADVVDDNRAWAKGSPARIAALTENYREVLARSSLTLANCVPVQAAMLQFTDEVLLVPNGCESPASVVDGPRPPELAALRGPVLGYVGNLSSRIDVELLHRVAERRPDWNLLLIGSTHAGRDVLALDRHPNVHLLGPRSYEVAKQYVRHFDVGLIPHLTDDMTMAMNPLKAFVYLAMGVPIVSTPVPNLDELAGHVAIAQDAAGFVLAVDDALRRGRPPEDDAHFAAVGRHSWRSRTQLPLRRVVELLEARP